MMLLRLILGHSSFLLLLSRLQGRESFLVRSRLQMFFQLCWTRELFPTELTVRSFAFHRDGCLMKLPCLVFRERIEIGVLLRADTTVKGEAFGRARSVVVE